MVNQRNGRVQYPDNAWYHDVYRARKRRRAPSIGIPKVSIQSRRSIAIGDEKAVYALYDQRLRFCQQQFTRLGSDVVQEMRHKEPDHLTSDERVALLCHILRLVVETPKAQHQAVRKTNLDLNKLEAITFGTLSTWLSDKQNPNNINKKPILREIFQVARQEHAYKCGEIDPKTEVYFQAMVDPRVARGPVDDESDEENIPVFTPSSSVGPPSESAVTMIHYAQTADPGYAMRVRGNYITGAMAMRTGNYTSPSVRSELAADHVTYMEPAGMANHAQSFGHSPLVLPEPYSGSQGPSRRASMYSSPQDYGSPAPGSLYPSWQNLPSTTSPTMYGFGGHLAPGRTHAPSTLDGLQTDTGSASQHGNNVYGLRPIEQPALHPQQGYPNYVPDAALMNGLDVKSENSDTSNSSEIKMGRQDYAVGPTDTGYLG
ncbi:hypothetical protein F5Y17DRAFT_475073 [Xylariaceae sp. FL0594]|nr:hypothetical protein F5Y17DRAFT_475073 [Xylariaceae sp. FL0594]